MTYVPTWQGFVYLAMVLDVFSRRVVGWSIGEPMRTELVLSTLDMEWLERQLRKQVLAEYFLLTCTLLAEFRALACARRGEGYDLLLRGSG